MVTGGRLMPSTQADSHGAGQTRPVNSGKSFVEVSDSSAACQRPWYTWSLKSGMMLPSGQPSWQKGTPQSMQRAPWARSSVSAMGSANSRQCRMRSSTGW